jgi:hypothetical protein
LLAVLASATPVRAESPLEVSGALLGTDECVEVRVDAKNVGAAPLLALTVGGDLLGRHRTAALPDLPPGAAASVILRFPFASDWRPGLHVLPLEFDYAADPGPVPARTRLLAYLLLPLAATADPALHIDAAAASLEIRAPLAVRLSSADGRAHRARVQVKTPPGIVAAEPLPVVDVPARGSVAVSVTLLRGTAPSASRQGLLVLAEALDGPIERMAVAPATVDVAPDAAWLPALRAPASLLAAVLLLAGGLAEFRPARS